MTAFWEVAIIQGRPCISARLQRALVFARFPNAYWHVEVSTPQKCVSRQGEPRIRCKPLSFTIEEAKLAGLAGKEKLAKMAKGYADGPHLGRRSPGTISRHRASCSLQPRGNGGSG